MILYEASRDGTTFPGVAFVFNSSIAGGLS